MAYYISSLSAEADLLLRVTHYHWAVENSLHWVLDVVFREDDARVRVGHAAQRGPETETEQRDRHNRDCVRAPAPPLYGNPFTRRAAEVTIAAPSALKCWMATT